jgi:isoquinoline 1-oxidoreductase beta subunit
MIENVSRRAFLGAMGAAGLILVVGCERRASAAGEPKYGADSMPHGWVDNPLAFVAIGTDGAVTIVCHRSEMGQGVRTSLPMVLADELEADWRRVRVRQATGDEERFGNQDTDGSRSMRHFFAPMRRCGAARPPRRAGAFRSARSRRSTTKWSTARRTGESATESSRPRRRACPSLAATRCA